MFLFKRQLHCLSRRVCRQWGQYPCTCCGCAANNPFVQVCVFCVRWRARKTHKLVLQLMVAAGDPPVREYCPPLSKKSHFSANTKSFRGSMGNKLDYEPLMHEECMNTIHSNDQI